MTRGQFNQGQSANPGGRPKVQADAARALARFIQAESDEGVDFAEFCFAILRSNPTLPVGRPPADESRRRRTLANFGVDPSMVTLEAKERAKDWLADRGVGKAVQFIDVSTGDEGGEGEIVPIDLSGMTLAELKDLKRRLKAGDPAGDAPAADADADDDADDDADEPDPPPPAATTG
jgi:hypothetical protein